MKLASIGAMEALHADEAEFLWVHRDNVLCSTRVALRDLLQYDHRLAAHIDGMRVLIETGASGIQDLDADGVGTLFATGVLALEFKEQRQLEALIARAQAIPLLASGLAGAFGWVSPRYLQGTVKELLHHTAPFQRLLGITCCAAHGVDPGGPLDAAVADADRGVREQALRAAGVVARVSLLRACMNAIDDEDTQCRMAAALSAVLLGDRGRALERLLQLVLGSRDDGHEALAVAFGASPVGSAHDVLQAVASDRSSTRILVRATGLVGDVQYVPWLIQQMATPEMARLAGGALSTITGIDLAGAGLDATPPRGFAAGPDDDPDDSIVAMDPDRTLPWPEHKRIEAWWAANRGRYTVGQRLFLGQPVTHAHCIAVLKQGYQWQRTIAARHLCLLEPGTPLFNVDAPAWRQVRWLASL